MVSKQCYREVEVYFENPTWISPNKVKTKEKMLMTPQTIREEKERVRQKISPYSKMRVGKKVCNVKKWRGY